MDTPDIDRFGRESDRGVPGMLVVAVIVAGVVAAAAVIGARRAQVAGTRDDDTG